MKQTINLGACGWRHRHWLNTFYPEDLPVANDQDDEDWRLAYYSNEFNTVLVPADYWQTTRVGDCEQWLDSVHAGFRFFVQCDSGMFERVSLEELTSALQVLSPQLSALVVLDQQQSMPEGIAQPFIRLADSLAVDIIGEASMLPAVSTSVSGQRAVQKIWQPDEQADSHFAILDDDLTDLRSVRAMVERFAQQFEDQLEDQTPEIVELTIIVNHPQLQAADLGKFRAVLDMMGY